jgi:hypothetical protein
LICGLPESGKTTFLAALWHLLTADSSHTQMRLEKLGQGDIKHLNALAKRWREAKEQIHTEQSAGSLVSMHLLGQNNAPLCLTFPDLSGESFQGFWETRDCSTKVASIMHGSEGAMLFINANRVRAARTLIGVASLSRQAGMPLPEGEGIKWAPTFAPTQVQLVDLLQHLSVPPLKLKSRRLAIVLSAWDKAEGELLKPNAYFSAHLPLLQQYLDSNIHGWDWIVYGISAQGGLYLNEKHTNRYTKDELQQIENLRGLDDPSTRIRVVSEKQVSNDLTEPLVWLMR